MARHGRNRNLGEPVARPVPTSCSDLPRRPVWPDKCRHFVHTFCTNKLHLVATCRDGRYGRTTSGNLAEMCEYSSGHVATVGHGPTSTHNLFTYIRNLSGRCSDHAMSRQPHHVVPMWCHSIQNGRNKVFRAVSVRHE